MILKHVTGTQHTVFIDNKRRIVRTFMQHVILPMMTLSRIPCNACAKSLYKTHDTVHQDSSNKKHMKEMPRLTAIQRERAIGMAQHGATHVAIARTFGYTRVCISRLMQRLRQTGQTLDRPRSGRPRVTTPVEDRHIRVIHLRNRFVTATETAATAMGHPVSRHTVYCRLRQAGIRARRPYRGVKMTRQHRRNIQVLPWPACSPDMNPIEHLWDHLDRQVRRRPPQPDNLQGLEQCLNDEWQRLTPNVIRRLTSLMRRRAQACIDAHGGHTRY